MTRFEKWSVLTGSAATGVTGAAYLWVKYAMEPTEPWAVINHPIQPWLLKAHILVAPLLVFAVGMIAVRHIWRHYRTGMKWGRRSGILSGVSLVPMIVTGYLIQGITHERWLAVTAWTHIVTSVLFLIGVTIHAVILARILVRSVPSKPSGAEPPPRLRRKSPRPIARAPR